MKRAKIMLTFIVVLAVLGGTLAFKANRKFNNHYCILTTDVATGQCTDELVGRFFVVGRPNPVTYYYTTKTAGDNCLLKDCTVSTSFVAEQ